MAATRSSLVIFLNQLTGCMYFLNRFTILTMTYEICDCTSHPGDAAEEILTKLTLLLTGKMPKRHPPDTLTFAEAAFVKNPSTPLFKQSCKANKKERFSGSANVKTHPHADDSVSLSSPQNIKVKADFLLSKLSGQRNRADLLPNFCLYLCQSHYYISAPAARERVHILPVSRSAYDASTSRAGYKPSLFTALFTIHSLCLQYLFALTIPGKISDNSLYFDSLIYFGFTLVFRVISANSSIKCKLYI